MFEGYNIISRLLLGFMVTTMTLSMWISNTATTAMMTPIVKAVLDELKQVSKNTAAIPFCEILLSIYTIYDLSNIKYCSYSNSVVMYIGMVKTLLSYEQQSVLNLGKAVADTKCVTDLLLGSRVL
jgi:di/tricarboxylate transporter